MTKRTKAEAVTDSNEFATINNQLYAPKRFKVGEVNSIMREKQERIKRFYALQRRAVQLQERAQLFQNVEAEGDNIPKEAVELMEQAHSLNEEMITIHEDTDNFWLLERAYPEAVEAGDLEQIDFDEVEAAIEKVFEVNPSLGKYRVMILQNPMSQNG